MSDSLWKHCSKADFYRYSAEFVRYSPDDIQLLFGEKFSLFMQWMLAYTGKDTLKAVTKGRVTNLLVVPKTGRKRKEFIRAYSGVDSLPANELTALYDMVEQKNYAQVSIYFMGMFTNRQLNFNNNCVRPMNLVDNTPFLKTYLLARNTFLSQMKEKKGKTAGKGLLGLINRPTASRKPDLE